MLTPSFLLPLRKVNVFRTGASKLLFRRNPCRRIALDRPSEVVRITSTNAEAQSIMTTWVARSPAISIGSSRRLTSLPMVGAMMFNAMMVDAMKVALEAQATNDVVLLMRSARVTATCKATMARIVTHSSQSMTSEVDEVVPDSVEVVISLAPATTLQLATLREWMN